MDNVFDRNFLQNLVAEKQQEQEVINAYPYLRNCLNAVSPDQKIYRIESFDNFLTNLTQKQLYFKCPEAWKDDKFDGVFVRTPIHFSQTGTQANHGYKRDYFCQCWSCEEMEVMWKLKSPEYKGIMIVSTVDKVMRQIWDMVPEPIQRYVGRVQYCPIEQIKSKYFFADKLGDFYDMVQSSGHGIATTFLFKPDSLSHENEVRFVIYEKQNEDEPPDHILVPAPEPKDYIDKIIIDPRAIPDFEKFVRSSLSKYPWLTENIQRSMKDPCTVNEVPLSEYYKKADDRYGLPSEYIFRDPPANKGYRQH